MAVQKKDIYVYADWQTLGGPMLMGVLSAHQAKGRKAFSFSYDKLWLKSGHQFSLDPDLHLFAGPQFAHDKENFGVFMDSMPDTWGRTLMKRREAQLAKLKGEKANKLYDIDFLLGVYDETRMGALRFKLDPKGDFLDNHAAKATPPWSTVRQLQKAVEQFENETDHSTMSKWLQLLIAPGSSLGGARPKANILDEHQHPWIAKFPSKNDTIDKAAWEYLAYQLAIQSGITMAPCRLEKIKGSYHTFFTKRFDRMGKERIHFASAMTMTGNNEDSLKSQPASYLDIAEFIQNNGAHVKENLAQLWRRIIFNIAISNTDDHLRNHGFILTDKGWILSPAYDLNPSIDKVGLALNIDMDHNDLDFEIPKKVGDYFRLTEKEMDQIIREVVCVVQHWQVVANKIGIPRSEQEYMAGAFNV
jgi:serine/threonine-protein kinase HipA